MMSQEISRKQNLVFLTKLSAIMYVALSLAEAGITYVCLQNPTNIEGNPFARMILTQNEALFYGSKFLVSVAVGYGFWWLADRTNYIKLVFVFQVVLLVLFSSILINNILHL